MTRGRTQPDGTRARERVALPHGWSRRRMLREVSEGLSAPSKELPSKYFYDAEGARLFEAITELPEYYLTRAERELLRLSVPTWFRFLRPRTLVELGAGSANKTRLLLDALDGGAVYVPVDLSEAYLYECAARLGAEYPHLGIEPEVADLTFPLTLSRPMERPVLFAFLGSTLGNFAAPDAVRLLGDVAALMGGADVLLLGVDLRPGGAKTVERVELAYNDAPGVTAAFNLNVLAVLNRELGCDFDRTAFEHRAFYAAAEGRIEMHLVSRRRQTVSVPGAGVFDLEEGESVRTELSHKYDRASLEALFAPAGLRVRDWREDAKGRYALVLAAAAGGA